ncbi:MAG: metal-dependent phosphohydrolase [Gammaproteobacteria bacterium]|nr:metal-dependent phosphohydrolase [Gammaproteobacteria bacterium]
MFNPNRTVIDAFVAHTLERYREMFPNCQLGHEEILEQAAFAALETLLNCDCPYHDMEHTMLVTEVGESILQGRHIAQGDVSASEWLHTVLACLFHDIGYLRGLLKQDHEHGYIADEAGNRVSPPPGATDAYLMPYHVTRGCIFVHERYAHEPLVDAGIIAGYIEMTRFPVPEDKHYQQIDTFAALVRAADLIGQMGDPLYIQKLSRLYCEFLETGEAEKLGYNNAGELRADYPTFFNNRVHPYIIEGLRYLRKTQEGQQWIANLFHHLHNEQENEPGWGPERDPKTQTTKEAQKPPRPNVAISNR